MKDIYLSLLVLRSANIPQLKSFYEDLGLRFEAHQHEKGPLHYAAQCRQTVLEIYPLAKNQEQADCNLRLGFSLINFEEILEKLKLEGIVFLSSPQETNFGYMVLVQDPDGRKVELYKQ